jgi:hypothetical protein
MARTMVSFRVSDNVLDELRRIAQLEGTTVSELIAEGVATVTTDRAVHGIRHSVTANVWCR